MRLFTTCTLSLVLCLAVSSKTVSLEADFLFEDVEDCTNYIAAVIEAGPEANITDISLYKGEYGADHITWTKLPFSDSARHRKSGRVPLKAIVYLTRLGEVDLYVTAMSEEYLHDAPVLRFHTANDIKELKAPWFEDFDLTEFVPINQGDPQACVKGRVDISGNDRGKVANILLFTSCVIGWLMR